MILLNVPYAEKDAARELGAKWDAGKKKWYIPAGVLATPFAQWMTSGDLPDKTPSKRTAQTVADKPAREAKRVDASAGRIVVGANYKPVEDASGPPWDV